MEFLNPLAFPFWIKMGLAVLCGGIIGFERQLRGKTAGLRTNILICMGSMVFILISLAVQTLSGDPGRVLGQLVTGIGFLGAGVILTREGVVKGLTTAAVIWVLAGIGALIGFGYHLAAVAVTLVSLFILSGVEFLETRFSSGSKQENKE